MDIRIDVGLAPNDLWLRLSRQVPKALFDFLATLVSSRHNPRENVYVVHVSEFPKFKEMVDSLGITDRDASVEALARIMMWQDEMAYDTQLKTSKFLEAVEGLKTKPYIDQIKGIQYLSTRARSLLADGMGVGKTLQTLGTYHLWRSQGIACNALVISINAVKFSWVKEVAKHTDYTVTMLPNGTEKILAAIEGYRHSPTDFIVLHYDALASAKVLEELLTLPIDVVLVDEAHLLKNMNTVRYKSVTRLLAEMQCPIQDLVEVTYELEDGRRVKRLARDGRVEEGQICDVY